jgi:hypothetical protein
MRTFSRRTESLLTILGLMRANDDRNGWSRGGAAKMAWALLGPPRTSVPRLSREAR